MTQVQHNMNALNAYNRLNANVAGLKKASEKLSSGYRINRAGDDAAGLAISEKMRSQIKGLNQATRNAQDGINMIQTFEGAAQETHSILQRMKELATESANGTYDNPTDRAAIQLEFDQLNDELNQIADTDYNGTIVLNGGEMSDGLKAVANDDGASTFDYSKAAAAGEALGDLVAKDYSGKAADLQDKTYITDATKSKAFWDAAEADGIGKDVSEVYVKYTATVDDDGKVTAYTPSYVDKDGNALKDVTGCTQTATQTTNGGFTDDKSGVVATFDTIGAKSGDFVTIKYTRPKGVPEPPTGIGFKDMTKADGAKVTIDDATKFEAGLDGNNVIKGTSIKLHANVSETNWKDATNGKDYQDAIEALNGATLEITWASAASNNTAIVPTLKIGNTTVAAGTSGTGWELSAALSTDGTTASVLTYNGKNIAELTPGVVKNAAAGATGGNCVGTFKVAVDGYRTSSTQGYDADLVSAAGGTTKVSTSNSFGQSKAIMTYTDNITLQTGARTKDAVNFTFKYNTDGTADMGTLKNNLNLSSREDGLNTANLKLSNQKDANYAIDQIDKAINKTSMVRATFGSIQNRLEHKITNLTTTTENLTEAESSIRDTDMASEMMNYTKFNILQQAAQSMLAQANQQPQSVLQLLG